MKVKRQSLWRRGAAQAAIFALIFQTVISVFGCGGALAHEGGAISQQGQRLSQGAKAAQSPAVCTAKGFIRMAANGGGSPTGGTDQTPQHDCPVCLTHCCHASVATELDAVLLPAPPVASKALALEARCLPLGAESHAFRNRGPPSPSVA